MAMKLCLERVGLARTDRQWGSLLRLEIDVPASATLLMGMERDISLDRDRDGGFRLDAPHGVDEIAGVLGPQLEADLAPQLARGQRLAVLGRSEIAEANLRDLVRGAGGAPLHEAARARRLD